MLLHEAATRAAKTPSPLLGRPTCMAIPAALSRRGVEPRLHRQSCLHRHHRRRVLYRDRGKDLASVVAQLDTIVTANAKLAEYHTRGASLASA